MTRTRAGAAAVLAALALPGAGCANAWYLVQQGAQQLYYACSDRPLDEVLRDPATPPATRAKLAELEDLRRFAIEHLALAGADQFRRYLDVGARPIAWNVSACRPLAFAPKRWDFPLVGTVEYLGFFRAADARAAARDLAAEGWETLVQPVAAYSTLGWFEDPITSSFLATDRLSRLATFVHELVHATYWRPGDVDFNENLASFVEDRGTEAYLRARHEPDHPARAAWAHRRADRRRFAALMRETADRLAEIYAGDDPDERKRERKAATLAALRTRYQEQRDRFHSRAYDGLRTTPLNNAHLLAFRRYRGEEELFAGLWRCAAGDWRTFFALLETAPTDPTRLRSWLRALPTDE